MKAAVWWSACVLSAQPAHLQRGRGLGLGPRWSGTTPGVGQALHLMPGIFSGMPWGMPCTQCKVLYVGKYSNPSFGPLGEHPMRHARGAWAARRFGLLAHPSTHSSYPGGSSSRYFRPDP